MTREEAIKIISTIYERQIKDNFKLEMHDSVHVEIDKAFNIAIKSLEAWDKVWYDILNHEDVWGTGEILDVLDKHMKEVE